MTEPKPPTLFEWMGGMPVLDRLMTRFYERVRQDAILAPLFAQMASDHPHSVALFVAEVLGGPKAYSQERGGHPHMIQRHLNRHLTQEQRAQWVRLLLATADEIGVPDDPEFRSALVGYLEWGSRTRRYQFSGWCHGRSQRRHAAMGVGRGGWAVPWAIVKAAA